MLISRMIETITVDIIPVSTTTEFAIITLTIFHYFFGYKFFFFFKHFFFIIKNMKNFFTECFPSIFFYGFKNILTRTKIIIVNIVCFMYADIIFVVKQTRCFIDCIEQIFLPICSIYKMQTRALPSCSCTYSGSGRGSRTPIGLVQCQESYQLDDPRRISLGSGWVRKSDIWIQEKIVEIRTLNHNAIS